MTVEDSRLKDIMNVNGNNLCADCKSPNPDWASVNLGIFVCISCSGGHRNLGTHISKVKSVKLDKWTSDQIEEMEMKGNEKSNTLFEDKKYLLNLFPKFSDSPAYLRDLFIRYKYDKCEFHKEKGKSYQETMYDYPRKVGVFYQKKKYKDSFDKKSAMLSGNILTIRHEDIIKTIHLSKYKIGLADALLNKFYSFQLISISEKKNYIFYVDTAIEWIEWYMAFRISKAQEQKLSEDQIVSGNYCLDINTVLHGICNFDHQEYKTESLKSSLATPTKKSAMKKFYLYFDGASIGVFKDACSKVPLQVYNLPVKKENIEQFMEFDDNVLCLIYRDLVITNEIKKPDFVFFTPVQAFECHVKAEDVKTELEYVETYFRKLTFQIIGESETEQWKKAFMKLVLGTTKA